MDKRSRLIRLVQVGRRELALDDECYRDLLASHTGKRSAALLSEQELELNRPGFSRHSVVEH